MTSDQPYRARLSVLTAKQEIEIFSGRQFDPAIVSEFLSMPENIWGDLRRGIEERDPL
jgi:HD-GYP domain-containing protein (c-di-GMP phosphodiesterase class II)